jgi:hypothetical protein
MNPIKPEFFDIYREKLKIIEDFDPGAKHIKFMMEEIPKIEDEGKMNRWLGFLQGWFDAKLLFSIDEMREHNRPLFKQ